MTVEKLSGQPAAISVAVVANNGDAKAIARLIPYTRKQGGFAVDVPPSQVTMDCELAVVDPRKGDTVNVEGSDTYLSTWGPDAFIRSKVIKDRFKLSFHPSGFVQFSPLARSSFVSGMAKSPIKAALGFGYYWSDPWAVGDLPGFEDPAASTFAVRVSGISDYPEPPANRPVELFESKSIELFARHHDAIAKTDIEDVGSEAYELVGYVLPRTALRQAESISGKLAIDASIPFGGGLTRHFRILDWGDPFVVVAIIVVRSPVGFPFTSYHVRGPLDLTWTMLLTADAPPMPETARGRLAPKLPVVVARREPW